MGNERETCNGTWRWRQARAVATISCIKILSNWPNEAKNSCVLRRLISCRRDVGGGPEARRLQDLLRMLNAAAQAARQDGPIENGQGTDRSHAAPVRALSREQRELFVPARLQ